MQLKSSTLKTLKQLSAVNSSLWFNVGSELRSRSPAKNIIAVATVDDVFPKEFGVYELSRFLGAISLFNPEKYDIDFGDEAIIITEGKRKLAFRYCDKKHIENAPSGNLDIPEVIEEFSLPSESFSKLLSSSPMLNDAPHFTIEGKDGVLSINIVNVKTEFVTDKYSEIISETTNTFKAVFQTQVLSVLAKDYDYNVKVTPRGTVFDGRAILYIILNESSSEFSNGI